jgi:hypothetical protein
MTAKHITALEQDPYPACHDPACPFVERNCRPPFVRETVFDLQPFAIPDPQGCQVAIVFDLLLLDRSEPLTQPVFSKYRLRSKVIKTRSTSEVSVAASRAWEPTSARARMSACVEAQRVNSTRNGVTFSVIMLPYEFDET